MNLVQKFQKELDVSKVNAVWRVIGFFFLSACFVATIVVPFVIFPRPSSFTEEVPLLPGNHVQVSKILDGEVLVGKTQFLQVAEGNTTFVSLEENGITYMTKVAGVSYRYDQAAVPRFPYVVSSQQIQQKGLVVRQMSRDTHDTVMIYIVLPLIPFIILFVFTYKTQYKHVSGYGCKVVWF